MSKENAMRRWVDAANPTELIKLAKLSKTTVGTLRQIAGAYRTKGVARTTPAVAQAISAASVKTERDGLPRIVQGDLCPSCAECVHYKSRNNQGE